MQSFTQRILLTQNQKHYELMKFRFNMNDGSFYMSFPRSGEGRSKIVEATNTLVEEIELNENRPYTFNLSYHTTGFIHYKNLGNRGIFIEPMHSVTQLKDILHYSIPSIDKLNEYTGDTTNCFCIDVPSSADGRNTFSIIIAPFNFDLKNYSALKFSVYNLFDLVLGINDTRASPDYISNEFITYTPVEELKDEDFVFSNEIKEITKLLLHQKVNNTQEIIGYPPNKEGIFKMIFAVPMRNPPRVNIIFKDKSLTFDIIESMHSRVSTAFKVRRGTYGIKHMVDIELVELDAEF